MTKPITRLQDLDTSCNTKWEYT